MKVESFAEESLSRRFVTRLSTSEYSVDICDPMPHAREM